jgi:hypothetical protein
VKARTVADSKAFSDPFFQNVQASATSAGDTGHDALLGTTDLGTTLDEFVGLDTWSQCCATNSRRAGSRWRKRTRGSVRAARLYRALAITPNPRASASAIGCRSCATPRLPTERAGPLHDLIFRRIDAKEQSAPATGTLMGMS